LHAPSLVVHSDAIRLPGGRAGPLATLARRLALAIGAILLVALIAWLGRDGYADSADDKLSFRDAVYYATVSVTTTGYGDIAPRSDSARLVNTVLITPIRIFFLVLLVGTTLETLSGRSRHALRVRNWRRTLKDHIIVCGFGTKGRSAVEGLRGKGVEPQQLVIVDGDAGRVEEAAELGYAAIHGDASSASVLRRAHAPDARAVVVAPDRDDTAVLITLTARELNPSARIVASVREQENAHLLEQGGADSVVVSSGAAGRLLGHAVHSPRVVQVLEDLLSVGSGLDIIEREVAGEDVGRPLGEIRSEAPVIAVVRGAHVLRFDDRRVGDLRAGDRLVCLCTAEPASGS
jgi:voltage-gated potassium channel